MNVFQINFHKLLTTRIIQDISLSYCKSAYLTKIHSDYKLEINFSIEIIYYEFIKSQKFIIISSCAVIAGEIVEIHFIVL